MNPVISDCQCSSNTFYLLPPGCVVVREPRPGCDCDVCERNREPRVFVDLENETVTYRGVALAMPLFGKAKVL